MNISRIVLAACTPLMLAVAVAPMASATAQASAPQSTVVALAKPTLSGPTTATVGQRVTLLLTYIDTNDSLFVITEWGDDTGTFVTNGFISAKVKKIKLKHRYGQPGSYLVTVRAGNNRSVTRRITVTGVGTSPAPPEESGPPRRVSRSVRCGPGLR